MFAASRLLERGHRMSTIRLPGIDLTNRASLLPPVPPHLPFTQKEMLLCR